MKTSQAWFREAGTGMFIHFGVYSVIGRGEWVMQQEQIPLVEYDRFISQFTAENYEPEEWARLAREAGMRYMVFTTKHHDGFCLFDTKTTNRNAVCQGPKRDLVKEYIAACRNHGLKVGLYFSLPDWSIPAFNQGPGKASPENWNAFIELVHLQVYELCSNYGQIDLLWYDRATNLNDMKVLTSENLRAEKLNAMVRRLQPDILINDRSELPEDFYTAEQNTNPPKDKERLWEACLTMNRHWGYYPADDLYKTTKELILSLTGIAMNRGNLLLNIGPKPDGTIDVREEERLRELGQWMTVHKETVTGVSPCSLKGGTYGCSAQKGDKVYLYVHWWHGKNITIPDCGPVFHSGIIIKNGQSITIQHDGTHLKLSDLPENAPDPFCTIIELTQQ